MMFGSRFSPMVLPRPRESRQALVIILLSIVINIRGQSCINFHRFLQLIYGVYPRLLHSSPIMRVRYRPIV
jgi:hypothetical protein